MRVSADQNLSRTRGPTTVECEPDRHRLNRPLSNGPAECTPLSVDVYFLQPQMSFFAVIWKPEHSHFIGTIIIAPTMRNTTLSRHFSHTTSTPAHSWNFENGARPTSRQPLRVTSLAHMRSDEPAISFTKAVDRFVGRILTSTMFDLLDKI